MLNIAIIGSTGSIGVQTLNIIRNHRDKFSVTMIAAQSNVEKLYEQYLEFSPKFVGVYNNDAYQLALQLIPREGLLVGREALCAAAQLDEVDIIVVAVSGMIGLVTVEAAIKNNKRIALANKESLVAGGMLLMKLLKQSRAKIIPIDSEHSAIMQCLSSGRKRDVKRLVLTASGGPFFGRTRDELKNVTLLEALAHPTWSMGKKITIDSATMMNKGLEIIEARYLFGIEKIDYIIHPESIVHSMVEYCDGSTIAQLGNPSMEIPIQYALTIPNRLETKTQPLELKTLNFFEPNEKVFPSPALAKYCLRMGLDYTCRFNAANEAATSLFMEKKIGFLDIYDTVERSVLTLSGAELSSIDDIMNAHNQTVEWVNKNYANKNTKIMEF